MIFVFASSLIAIPAKFSDVSQWRFGLLLLGKVALIIITRGLLCTFPVNFFT